MTTATRPALTQAAQLVAAIRKRPMTYGDLLALRVGMGGAA